MVHGTGRTKVKREATTLANKHAEATIEREASDLYLMAQKLSVAEMLGSYLHEQSHLISYLSASFSSLFHEIGLRERGASEKLKALEQSISSAIDQMHSQNSGFQRFLRRNPERVEPLHGVIRAINEIFGKLAARNRVRLQVNIEPQADRAIVPSSLYPILVNLLMNALAATPPRSRISLEASLREHLLSIAVTDAGQGIPASLEDKIWEPFFTTSSGKTGFGLFVCREWAKSVGASVSIDASYVHGARFVVKLPLAG